MSIEHVNFFVHHVKLLKRRAKLPVYQLNMLISNSKLSDLRVRMSSEHVSFSIHNVKLLKHSVVKSMCKTVNRTR